MGCNSARRLATTVDRYLLLSSTAAYSGFDRLPVDESLPFRGPRESGYGARKADCEREAEAALPGRVCLPRSVYAGGAGDPDARLDAWFTRIMSQSILRLPGASDTAVLLVDVADLAAFIVALVETRDVGPFNVAHRMSCRPSHEPRARMERDGRAPSADAPRARGVRSGTGGTWTRFAPATTGSHRDRSRRWSVRRGRRQPSHAPRQSIGHREPEAAPAVAGLFAMSAIDLV